MRDDAMDDEDFSHDERRKPIFVAEDAASDDFFELLSRQLGEAAEFADEAAPDNDVLWLLEENARLRALAVKLSTLVGDLSDREWRAALASADLATLDRARSPRP